MENGGKKLTRQQCNCKNVAMQQVAMEQCNNGTMEQWNNANNETVTM